MSYETIVLDVDQNVATITLNRPEALNALTDEMGDELEDAAFRCRADSSVRALIVKGAGRAFCAGVDIKMLAQSLGGGLPAGRRMLAGLHAAIIEFRRMEKPVIAQVHGFAVGAGMGLALACDLTIVAETARFIPGYGQIGLSADGSMTYFLPRLVGLKKALEFFYMRDTIDAGEAYRLGMVNQVVAETDLEKETRALAARLAKGPTLALARTKDLIYRSFSESLETQLENERSFLALSAVSEDFREGVQAFIEKREPRFMRR